MLEVIEKTFYAVEDTRKLNFYEMIGMITTMFSDKDFAFKADMTWEDDFSDILQSLIEHYTCYCNPDQQSVTLEGGDVKFEFIPKGEKGLTVKFYAYGSYIDEENWSIDDLEMILL